MDLKQIYDDLFIKKDSKGKTKFEKVFYGADQNDFRKKIDLLYNEYFSTQASYKYNSDAYSDALRESVRKYTRNKDSLINVYKDFSNYLSEKGFDVRVEYPPIPVSNTFERLMFIAKYLQDENNQINDLQDILLQSERTIENDIAKLRGLDDDPLQVCGEKFVIDRTERNMGRLAFDSTAHPIFLTPNLTQVITLLNGLKILSEKQEYRGYAIPLARNIWNQLSEYAKERIFYVSEELLKMDISWYKSLEATDGNIFYSENACSTEGCNVILECLKSDGKKTCVIEYKTEKGSIFYENAIIKDFHGDSVDISVDGNLKNIELSKVLRSSYYCQTMF